MLRFFERRIKWKRFFDGFYHFLNDLGCGYRRDYKASFTFTIV